MARMLPGEAELVSDTRNEQVCHGRKSVKRFEPGPTDYILRYFNYLY